MSDLERRLFLSEQREGRAHAVAIALDETIRQLSAMLVDKPLSVRRVQRIRMRLTAMHTDALNGVEPSARPRKDKDE